MCSTDEAYFNSYGDIFVHELMLKDKIRTDAYGKFIEEFKNLFKDKIVLDVGAGTGILSLFAARSGAKKVYAVEANEHIYNICLDIVESNNLQNVIEVIHNCVENINIEKVDILMSEWMGFYLLHESMLDSVINSRDRFLKPDGIMIPAFAEIYICPTSLQTLYNDNTEIWKSFNGFNLSAVGKSIWEENSKKIKITTIPQTDLISEPKIIASFDLKFVDYEDLNVISASFEFTANKHSVHRGYAFWFSVSFLDNSHDAPLINPHVLNTSPFHPDTHWHQTIVPLSDSYLVSKDQTFNCSVDLIREKSRKSEHREINSGLASENQVNKTEVLEGEEVISKAEADSCKRVKLEKDCETVADSKSGATNSKIVNARTDTEHSSEGKQNGALLEYCRRYTIVVHIPDGDDDEEENDDDGIDERGEICYLKDLIKKNIDT